MPIMVKGTMTGHIDTTSEKFENASLFLRLGLPSTLLRQENGAFQERSTKWKENSLKTGLFENDDVTLTM